MTQLTQEYLKECLHYDPDTGLFTWKERPRSHFKLHRICKTWNSRFSGQTVGARCEGGYLVGRINSRLYFLHRLAFLYMVNELPEMVDHENHVRDDNRWRNLKPAAGHTNPKNSSMYRTNTTGVTGVVWSERYQHYRAQIQSGNKAHHLGCFKFIDGAVQARKSAEEKYDFHQNHGKKLNA